MSEAQDVLTEINRAADQLSPEECRRPGVAFDKFSAAMSEIFAQAEKDRIALTSAKYPINRYDLNKILYEQLSLTHGARIGEVAPSPEAIKRFETEMPLAERDRKYLMSAYRHILERTGYDKQEMKSYKRISRGSGPIDALHDVVSLADKVDAYPQYAAEISPAGVNIDPGFAAAARTRAVSLLALKGIKARNADGTSPQVDRQNRLIELCIRARAEIRKYAEAAFIDTPDYFAKYYGIEEDNRPQQHSAS